MKKFQKFEFHDYMDMEPREEVRVCTKEEAVAYIDHMKEHWNSGTSRYIGEMSLKEAFTWVVTQILVEMSDQKEDTVEFIENLENSFIECYCKE